MYNSENPLPPENDPLAELLECNIETMSSADLSAYVDRLHSTVNNPRELSRLIKGKTKAIKTTSKASLAEKAIIDSIMGDLV